VTDQPLLSADLLGRLERLQLHTRRRLVGHLTGNHRSPRHGSSLDFADYREYHPGDDPRRIDLHAYARLDRLLIKLFEAEEDLSVRLLIDSSGSMSGAKLRYASQLAAAIGFTALVRRDVVTVHTFPQTSEGPRYLGRVATAALFRRLENLEAQGVTPFADAAIRMLARRGPPGLTVVVSDLLTTDWDAGLRRLPARSGDLVVIHVLDRTDLEPELVGDLELVDSETGTRLEVSLSSSVVEDFRQLANRWADEVAGRVRSVGGSYLRVFTDEDVEQVILGRARGQGVTT